VNANKRETRRFPAFEREIRANQDRKGRQSRGPKQGPSDVHHHRHQPAENPRWLIRDRTKKTVTKKRGWTAGGAPHPELKRTAIFQKKQLWEGRISEIKGASTPCLRLPNPRGATSANLAKSFRLLFRAGAVNVLRLAGTGGRAFRLTGGGSWGQVG